MPFAALGLSVPLVNAAALAGFTEPTPVQDLAIPAILTGSDVLGLAQTGSGKTAAFCLPLLQRLQPPVQASPQASPHSLPNSDHGQQQVNTQRIGRTPVRALVLVPTRELAAQVGDVLLALSNTLPQRVKTTVVFGGVSINPQMMGLRSGADVVVATPGRLLDLVDHNALDLSAVAVLVLDEADRLLDLGFADELNRILALLPKRRQNLFFSATFPQSVQALADGLLQNPQRIEIAATTRTTPAITQRAIEVDNQRRTQLLRHLVQTEKWPRALVFVATKHAAEIVADKLRKADIWAEPFHGLLSQGKRSQVLADFKTSRVQVVVATDLAARGIDIVDLPVVVNYDLPRSSVDYVHRIGRTARAGTSGLAVSFVTRDMAAHFELIEKRHGIALARERVAGFEPLEIEPPAFQPQSGNTLPVERESLNSPQPTMPPGARAVSGVDAPRNAQNGAPGSGGIKGSRPSKKDKLRAAQSRNTI